MSRSSGTSSSEQSRHSSAKPSPAGSVHSDDADASIETLISWLVAAKRSLSSIHHVHRATTLLAKARLTIESTAALVARTKYLKRSLHSQLKILRAVQGDLEGAAQSIKQEINGTVKELEQADGQLQHDIERLRQTRIENGFRLPAPRGEQDVDLTVQQKDTLQDFVDDQPVEALRQHATAALGRVRAARSEIDASIRALEDDLQKINEVLADKTAISSSTKSDLHPTSVPRQLGLVERNAHDMAQGLESLVQHFDSCVNAIKHTEGAGAAVAKNFTTEDLPDGVDVEAFQGPTESMSEKERTEMLRVLKSDADQVDDVVADIQERGAEMEAQLDRILLWRDSCEASYRDVASAFKLLEKVGRHLPSHVQEVAYFTAHWQEEKAKIEDCIAGMDQLCEVYENFLTAYDGMIVEAARRRAVRKRMEKIVQEAQSQLDQLYEDDVNEREHFRSEQGEHLPSDIWHGLNVLPAQYGFQRLDTEGLDNVPELPKEIVAGALGRLKAVHGIKDADER